MEGVLFVGECVVRVVEVIEVVKLLFRLAGGVGIVLCVGGDDGVRGC